MYPLYNWLLIVLGVLLGSIGSLFMKSGAAKLPQEWDGGLWGFFFRVVESPLIVAGVVLYAIPAAIWIWLLRIMPLTVVQPALALTYVVSAVFAMFFLNESVPFIRWVGIAVIVFGVVLVGRS